MILKVIFFFHSILVSVICLPGHIAEIISGLKTTYLESFIRTTEEPAASLMISMIFGDELLLSEKIKHYFEVTGMQHVLVASGSNVSLMAMLGQNILSRFWVSRRVAYLGALLFTWIYFLSTNREPPVLRAVLMISLSLYSQILQRQYSALWSLFLSALIMIICSPEIITSVSFQLSVSATLGILLFFPATPDESHWLRDLEIAKFSDQSKFCSWGKKVVETIKDSFRMTMAAQALTAPIIIFHFQRCSLITPLVNTLIIWCVPLITIAGFVTIFFSAILCLLPQLGPTISALINLVPAKLCNFFLMVISWFGQNDKWLIKVSFPTYLIILWFVGLFWIKIFRRKRKVWDS